MNKIVDDPRIDPRIKMLLGALPTVELSDVKDRESLLAEVNAPKLGPVRAEKREVPDLKSRLRGRAVLAACDREDHVALAVPTHGAAAVGIAQKRVEVPDDLTACREARRGSGSRTCVCGHEDRGDG